jgi:hypothetical protein
MQKNIGATRSALLGRPTPARGCAARGPCRPGRRIGIAIPRERASALADQEPGAVAGQPSWPIRSAQVSGLPLFFALSFLFIVCLDGLQNWPVSKTLMDYFLALFISNK